MHTLTLKAGDLMTKADIRASEENTRSEKHKNEKSLLETGKRIAKSVVKFMCSAQLKIKLKDTGSSIKCDGRIRISGSKNIKIGDNSRFGKNVQLRTEGRGYIHIGDNVKIGSSVKIISKFNVTIEDNTIIGDNVTIYDILYKGNGEFSENDTKPVYIGKDVWIGRDTQIHAGVTIGHGATITSKSSVMRSIPPDMIAGGSPARVIRET
jgi:acetyltransferase-like isoleucine patch superfamily enzyme